MIALGLALFLIASGATVFAVIASTTPTNATALSAFGVTVSVTPLAMFMAGALSVALFGLGFALVSRGTRRKARKHKELKQLRKDSATATTQAGADREAATAAEGADHTSAGNTGDSSSEPADASTHPQGNERQNN